MSNMMKAGALALALTGFAVAGALPAEAAVYNHPSSGITVTVSHGYGTPWWWSHHPRPKHKVRVCTTHWHNHHKVTTCSWVWKSWK